MIKLYTGLSDVVKMALNGNDTSQYQSMAKHIKIPKLVKNMMYKLFMKISS